MGLSAGSSSNTNKSTTSEASFNSGAASSESSLSLKELEAQIIEELGKMRFTTISALKKAVESRHQALQRNTTHNQYLVYTDVPRQIHSQLTGETSRVNKTSRFSYNSSGTLVIKVMPNPEHDVAAGNIDRLIDRALTSMGVTDELDSLRSTTVQIGSWTKEADAAWGPRGRGKDMNLVIEVGLSEFRQHLTLDARGWLETPTSTVKVVLVISVNRTQPEVEFRLFELAPRRYQLAIRASPDSAICTQTIRVYRVNGTTAVNGSQLVLPFAKVVGREARTPAEGDIIIPVAQLQLYAEAIWLKQHLI